MSGRTGTDDHVLALDIGGTKLAAGLVDVSGHLHGKRMVRTERDAGASVVLASALGLVEELLADNAIKERRPQALGVSTNGLTREDRVDLAPAVGGWEGLRIPPELRRRFPDLRVTIMNDVKAATAAEMTWGALRGVSEGLYVNLGTGLAVGLVSDGRLLQGAHGAAGEVGYLVPSMEALSDRQPGQAVLEERIAGRGVEKWSESKLGRRVTIAELVKLSDDDPRARALRGRLVEEIALWIANIAIVVDPSRIVLGGGIVRSLQELTDRTQELVSVMTPFPAEVRIAHFEADSALLGAGAVALSGDPHIHPAFPQGV